ncbi:MAG: plastocyanin [Planctomycetota bacterium]|jgi:plastocyanin
MNFLRLFAPLFLLSSMASADTIVVTQSGFTFQPQDITIATGDTVRWVWESGNHDVVEGTDGTVDGDEAFYSILISAVPTFEFTFDAAFLAANPRPGNLYDYFCNPHFGFGMVGTVSVEDAVGTAFCDCGVTSACGNPSSPGEGCANSSGSGATLTGAGSGVALLDDLTLSASNLIPGQAALLFVGTIEVNGGNGLAFGDGLRCAGGSVTRLGVRIPSAGGNATWGPGLNSASNWSSGDTRNFQVWYRDSTGGPCGNQFNLSNGYGITFN